MTKLSPIQLAVMQRAKGGWALCQSQGSAITVDGKRICNRATIDALVRRELLVQVGRWKWMTPEHAEKQKAKQ